MLQDKEHKLKSQAWRIFQPIHHMHWKKNRFIILSLPQIIVLCAQVGTRPKLMSSIALPQPPPLCLSATQLYLCHLFSQHNVTSSSQFPFYSRGMDAGSCLLISCTKYSKGRAGSDTWVQWHHEAALTYGVALPHFTPSVCNLCHFGGPK